MLRPPHPRAPGEPPEDPRIIRAIARIDRAGGQLDRLTIAAYERARRELLGRLLTRADESAPITEVGNRMILAQVEETLRQLYADLSRLYGDRLASLIEREAAQAIEDIQRLPLWQAADRAMLEQSGIMAPRISRGTVRNLVETAGDRIVAVNDTIRAQVRGALTTSAIRGQGVHETMKRILAESDLTLEGIRPVFPSVYDRARTIARTEVSNAANMSHLAKYTEAADMLPDLLVRWSSVLCSTTCKACRALHFQPARRPGELWRVVVGRQVIEVTHPPLHPRCLCRLVAHFAGDPWPKR
jgi:hypothetical protein